MEVLLGDLEGEAVAVVEMEVERDCDTLQDGEALLVSVVLPDPDNVRVGWVVSDRNAEFDADRIPLPVHEHDADVCSLSVTLLERVSESVADLLPDVVWVRVAPCVAVALVLLLDCGLLADNMSVSDSDTDRDALGRDEEFDTASVADFDTAAVSLAADRDIVASPEAELLADSATVADTVADCVLLSRVDSDTDSVRIDETVAEALSEYDGCAIPVRGQ